MNGSWVMGVIFSNHLTRLVFGRQECVCISMHNMIIGFLIQKAVLLFYYFHEVIIFNNKL